MSDRARPASGSARRLSAGVAKLRVPPCRLGKRLSRVGRFSPTELDITDILGHFEDRASGSDEFLPDPMGESDEMPTSAACAEVICETSADEIEEPAPLRLELHRVRRRPLAATSAPR